jgi:hypothetical protein
MSHTDHILNVMGEKIKLAPGLVERLEFQKEFEDDYDEATLRQVPALATGISGQRTRTLHPPNRQIL